MRLILPILSINTQHMYDANHTCVMNQLGICNNNTYSTVSTIIDTDNILLGQQIYLNVNGEYRELTYITLVGGLSLIADMSLERYMSLTDKKRKNILYDKSMDRILDIKYNRNVL